MGSPAPPATLSEGEQRGVSRNAVKTIARAMDFACRKHMAAAQRLEKPFGPTLVRLAEIGRILAELTDGKDQILVAAGILHNVARDAGCPIREVEARFGPEAAQVVAELTGAPLQSSEEHWRTELAMASTRSPRAKMIMMVVHATGLLSLSAPKPDMESVSRRIERLILSARVVSACRDAFCPLGGMFDRAYGTALSEALNVLQALPAAEAIALRKRAEEATRLRR